MKRRMNVFRDCAIAARSVATGLATAGLAALSLSMAFAQGSIVSWGSNQYGQKSGAGSPTTTIQISAGANHTLALDSAGNVWAWGDNRLAQLGVPNTGAGGVVASPKALKVAGIANAVQIAAGQDFSLVLTNDGKVWGFGNNDSGQLGDGTTTLRTSPVQVSGLANVVQIAAGGYHGLALLSDGTVRSWGQNKVGALGDGTTATRTVPVQVKNVSNVINIAAGYFHSLAVGFDGKAWAWGWNRYGQVGDGTNINRNAPVQMTGLSGVQQVSAGSYHSIALGFDGSVWTTGYNLWGQIGDGTSGSSANKSVAVSVIPAPVGDAPKVVQVAAGNGHNLVVKSDGTMWGWGNNEFGQVGDGTGTNRSLPVQVLLAGQTFATAGWYHSAATKAIMQDSKVVLAGSSYQYATPALTMGGALKSTLLGASILQQPLTITLGGVDLITALTPANDRVFYTLPNTLDYNVGSYDYTITYPGNRLYNPAVRKGKLVISKADTPQRANGFTNGKIGQTVTLATILRRKSDNSLMAGKTIHFMLDAVPLGDVVTDANGRAAMLYKLEEPLAVGAHTLATTYDGDSNHKASTLSIPFTVNPSASSLSVGKITAGYGQTVNLQATLTRKTDNKRLAGLPVKFSIDDVEIGTANTGVNGSATVPYKIETPFALGAHTIKAEFAGTDNYIAITNTAVFTVVQGKTGLSQANQLGKVGAAITLKATLTRTADKMALAGKTITFTVNGVVVGTADTDDTGVALFPTNVPDLPTGKYKLIVSFAGDASYVAATNATGVLTVR